MTLKTAQKKLQIAQAKAREIKKEIEDLKNILKNLGADLYPERKKLIARNIAIYKRHAEGASFVEIGREYKRSGTMVGNICKRIDHYLESRKGDFEDYKELLRFKLSTKVS